MLKSFFLSACGLCLAGAVNVARAAVVLSDDFTYTDGALTNVSSGKWMAHSGANTLPVDVVGGKIVLKQANAEDVSALLDGQPYSLTNAVQFYASFKVSFSVLPAAGAYFAHFKDASTGFRARLFATTNGAGSGAFRLAIASTIGVVSNAVPTGDLNLNTEYVVVCRLILSNAVSTLWINPSSETDASVTSTDSATPIVVTSFAFRQPTQNNGMGTLTVDDLRIGTEFSDVVSGGSGGNGPPVITLQPSNQTVTSGDTATFSVGATGAQPLNYQWQFNSANLDGATNAALVLTSATTNQAGTYRVAISNARGTTDSDSATLTVLPRPLATVTNIAYLRTLVDAQTFAPTDTATLYAAEGVVTTYVNLTTAPNASFYMQDSTAGINVFVGGSTTIRPNAGDRVRVTGPLGHFNGLFEFNMSAANSAHTVVTLSTNNLLPVPKPLAFSLQNDPALIEPLEGSLVVVSNVFLDVTQPNFPPPSDAAGVGGGGNVTMTNALGETFVLRVDGRVHDITSQPKPTVPVTIIGVLAQFDGSSPYTTGYQLTPTRFADIIGAKVAPKIEFTNALQLIRVGDAPTNTFVEHVLLPGERIDIRVHAYDPLGRPVDFKETSDSFSGAQYKVDLTNLTGNNLVGTFTLIPTTNSFGKKYTFRLEVKNAEATNAATWTIYVPTEIEQRITIGEFLANAPGTEVTPYPNILNRPGQPPAQNSDDEFVELVNLSSQDVDLLGWMISDSVQMRHKFYESRMIGSSNALVVYGGPLNGFAPQLDVPVVPASENVFGFGLNNTGGDSILLRNAQSNLITRVVYSLLPTNSTMTRFPDMNGNFVGQFTVSTNAGSPGRQYDGKVFSESPSVTPPAAINVSASLATATSVRLRWNAESGRIYSVFRADNVSGPFNSVATGLTFTTATGEYIDPLNATALARFYRITTP